MTNPELVCHHYQQADRRTVIDFTSETEEIFTVYPNNEIYYQHDLWDDLHESDLPTLNAWLENHTLVSLAVFNTDQQIIFKTAPTPEWWHN